MKKLNTKGFTLIELLAVIVILAIVAAVTMTIIVPMISGKGEEGALTSVSNMRQQIVNACSGLGVEGVPGAEGMYGDFDGTVTVPSGGTANACLTGTCTISFTPEQLTAMKISGELPATTVINFDKCSITSGTFTFGATGQFANLVVELDSTGKASIKE